MDEKTTGSLSRVLEGMSAQAEAEEFVQRHGEPAAITFREYLARQIQERGIDRAEVVRRCGISTNYVYNILSGARGNPGRDKVLALCIASEMTYRQTRRALEICGHAPLYPRDERDVRIAIAINEGVRDVLEVNLTLDRYGLKPLDI